MLKENSIFIYVDHAGFVAIKALHRQLEGIGLVADMAILMCFKENVCFALSNVTPEEFGQLQKICCESAKIQSLTVDDYHSAPFDRRELNSLQETLTVQQITLNLVTEGIFEIFWPKGKTEEQEKLKGFYDDFRCKNKILNPGLLSQPQFFNFLFQLKQSSAFQFDPYGWYLFGDWNLGSPNGLHLSKLFEQLMQCCAAPPCSVLNVYPYSQNDDTCANANQELSKGKTATYEDEHGVLSGGFPLKGFAANKLHMAIRIASTIDPKNNVSPPISSLFSFSQDMEGQLHPLDLSSPQGDTASVFSDGEDAENDAVGYPIEMAHSDNKTSPSGGARKPVSVHALIMAGGQHKPLRYVNNASAENVSLFGTPRKTLTMDGGSQTPFLSVSEEVSIFGTPEDRSSDVHHGHPSPVSNSKAPCKEEQAEKSWFTYCCCLFSTTQESIQPISSVTALDPMERGLDSTFSK